jgi:hypothetical protein
MSAKWSRLPLSSAVLGLGLAFWAAGCSDLILTGHQSMVLWHGAALTAGASAYKARRRHLAGDRRWFWLELAGMVMLALVLAKGLLVHGLWYEHPLAFVVVPAWSIVACIRARPRSSPGAANPPPSAR